MEPLLESIADNLIWVIAGVCFVIGCLIKSITMVLTQTSRERSRREIAAYVAEGSMSSEQGERLIRAEIGGTSGSCAV